MNTHQSIFDDIAAGICDWGKLPFGEPLLREYAAQESYQNQTVKETAMTNDNTQLIIQGVQACSLAGQVLRVTWGNPDTPDARATVAMAEAVLKSWGIELTTTKVPATDLPTAPEPKPAELVWPPVDRCGRALTTTLPDVYRENYYHVRESAYAVAPEHLLVLRGAYWNEEALQWRMQFTCSSLPQVEPFWIDHCQVRVGDEIPKDPPTP